MAGTIGKDESRTTDKAAERRIGSGKSGLSGNGLFSKADFSIEYMAILYRYPYGTCFHSTDVSLYD